MFTDDHFGRSESDLALELDPLPLPEGVVLGYRSSAPIIELKLTGPASQRSAMEQVWQQVRAVAGESTLSKVLRACQHS